MSGQSELMALLQSSNDEGKLSDETTQKLVSAEALTQIQQGMGVSVKEYPHSKVMLVTLLLDDSGSIAFKGNEASVREGHNLVLESLLGSKQKDTVLVHCRLLNGGVVYPFSFLGAAPKMTEKNYQATGGTPLWDELMITLGTVQAKAQEFENEGVSCTTWTMVLTDGADEHSRKSAPADVKDLIDSLMRSEIHTVLAMGVDDGKTNFREVFKQIGLNDQWVLTPGNSASEIRRAFRTASQSAVALTAPAQVNLGGFGI